MLYWSQLSYCRVIAFGKELLGGMVTIDHSHIHGKQSTVKTVTDLFVLLIGKHNGSDVIRMQRDKNRYKICYFYDMMETSKNSRSSQVFPAIQYNHAQSSISILYSHRLQNLLLLLYRTTFIWNIFSTWGSITFCGREFRGFSAIWIKRSSSRQPRIPYSVTSSCDLGPRPSGWRKHSPCTQPIKPCHKCAVQMRSSLILPSLNECNLSRQSLFFLPQ